MENLIYFILGMGTVLLIGFVVFMSNMWKKIKNLTKEVDNVNLIFQNVYTEFERIKGNTSQEIEKIYREIELIKGHTSQEIEKIYREIDSRLDKLANKFQLEKKENNKDKK